MLRVHHCIVSSFSGKIPIYFGPPLPCIPSASAKLELAVCSLVDAPAVRTRKVEKARLKRRRAAPGKPRKPSHQVKHGKPVPEGIPGWQRKSWQHTTGNGTQNPPDRRPQSIIYQETFFLQLAQNANPTTTDMNRSQRIPAST